LKTTKIKVGDNSIHHFSRFVEITRKITSQIIRKRESKTQAKMWLLFISTLTVFPFSKLTRSRFGQSGVLIVMVSAVDSESFVVSISAGKGKPKSIEEFLGMFLEDMIQLKKEGYIT
jgi:hypothetical protein